MTTVGTCVNCSNEAVYTYLITDNYSKSYCASDLPNFLKSKEYSTRVVDFVKESAPVEVQPTKTSKKKTAAPVVEESPVVVEEVEESEVKVEETKEDAPEVPEDK